MTTLIQQLLLKKKKMYQLITNSTIAVFCGYLTQTTHLKTFKSYVKLFTYYCITVNASIGAARCP